MALLDIVRAVDRRLGLGLSLWRPARRLRHARRRPRPATATSCRRLRARSACRCTSCAWRASRAAPNFQERAREISLRRRARDRGARRRRRRRSPRTTATTRPRPCSTASSSTRRRRRCAPCGRARTVSPGRCCAWGRPSCAPTAPSAASSTATTRATTRHRLPPQPVRHEVLPVLATINPRVAETLADAAALADDEHAVLAAAVDGAWDAGRPAVRGSAGRRRLGARPDGPGRRAARAARALPAPPRRGRAGRRRAARPPRSPSCSSGSPAGSAGSRGRER